MKIQAKTKVLHVSPLSGLRFNVKTYLSLCFCNFSPKQWERRWLNRSETILFWRSPDVRCLHLKGKQKKLCLWFWESSTRPISEITLLPTKEITKIPGPISEDRSENTQNKKFCVVPQQIKKIGRVPISEHPPILWSGGVDQFLALQACKFQKFSGKKRKFAKIRNFLKIFRNF